MSVKTKKPRIGHLDRYFNKTVMREALAHIISGLELNETGKGGLVGLTASSHGEGVTTLALYLGVEVVRTFSKPTLVVEANCRRPGLASYCKAPKSPGLKDVVTGQGLKMGIKVHSTQLENLFILPAGGTHPHPLGLFTSERYTRFIQEARMRFPIIIVDAPPILQYAETSAILKPLELSALIVSAGETREETVQQAVYNLEDQGVKLVGTLLNRMR